MGYKNGGLDILYVTINSQCPGSRKKSNLNKIQAYPSIQYTYSYTYNIVNIPTIGEEGSEMLSNIL